MKRKYLEIAMEEISDKHIAEAARRKKRLPLRWTGAAAAVLAAVILAVTVLDPLTLQAKAVSSAQYPQYRWQYRGEEMEAAREQLSDFFTASMRQTLSGSGANNAYSPVNLYLALCLMTELTETDSQILGLLNADSQEALRAQAGEVWHACYRDDGDQTLLANSVWLDEGLRYNQTVMDTLAEHYYTSVYQSDLQGDAASAIIDWLNQQTGNLLKAETGHLHIDPETLLLLCSTVYYQAKWGDDFSAAQNTRGTFHSVNGDTVCTFMNKKQMKSSYYWAEDFGAVRLHLNDGSNMWFLLPDGDKTVDQVLASEEFARLLTDPEAYENSKYVKINLSIPKFDIRASGDLKDDLQALGVTDVFHWDTAGTSTAIIREEPLVFTGVNQATRVAIDEKGVTAASYLEIQGAGDSMPPEEIVDFIADRPFLFVIANRYALPLFAGVVNEP